MNNVVLTGRFTADPEVRYSNGENQIAIASFTLAVNRRYVKKDDPNAQTADFIRCQAFGKTAEFVEKYFRKGMKADLVGSIRTGKYTNKEGQTVYTTDVAVDNIEFGESKGSSGDNAGGAVNGSMGGNYGGATGVIGGNYGGYTGGVGQPQMQQPPMNNGPYINIPQGIDENLPFT